MNDYRRNKEIKNRKKEYNPKREEERRQEERRKSKREVSDVARYCSGLYITQYAVWVALYCSRLYNTEYAVASTHACVLCYLHNTTSHRITSHHLCA
jgi:hypothetical protein